jgi:biotin synthase
MGGIIGMGESIEDRAGMLVALSTLNPQPESVPINALVAVEALLWKRKNQLKFGNDDTNGSYHRIIMPETQVRLSAGRMNMSREQAMCFFSGANSILQEINY